MNGRSTGGRWLRPTRVSVQAFCLASASLVWTVLGWLSPAAGAVNRRTRFAHLAAQGGLAIVAAVTISGLGSGFLQHHLAPSGWQWVVWLTVTAATLLQLWDARGRRGWFELYATGLCAAGLLVQWLSPDAVRQGFNLALGLAAYALLASVFAKYLTPDLLASPMRNEDQTRFRLPEWFLTTQTALAAIATALGFWITLSGQFDTLWRRLAGPAAMAGVVVAIGLASSDADSVWRRGLRGFALTLGALVMASLALACVPAEAEALWLQRWAALMIAASAAMPVYAFGLRKWFGAESSWTVAGRRCLPFLSAAAALALSATLVLEITHFKRPDGTLGAPLAVAAVVGVALSLAGMLLMSLRFALSAKSDPLRLSDSGRQVYVYGAELIAALIWLHLYLCIPKLFQIGILEKWWTLIVMLIAFAGAGLAELFHRRGMPILSRPLERSAAVLPLLPVIFSLPILSSTLPRLIVALRIQYWSMLFLVSVFYAFLGYARRSLAYSVLAIVAGVSGFWTLLLAHDIPFIAYPHIWLIPVGLVALVAEFINHDRLAPAQQAAIRYTALSLIYVSATADMFLDGLAKSMPGGALLLMALAIAGSLAGMLLRVRSFLSLGVAFLCLDLITMIKYAAVDLQHTWVLWAAGIATGAGILTLFAFFEKRRNSMLSAIEHFKSWER